MAAVPNSALRVGWMRRSRSSSARSDRQFRGDGPPVGSRRSAGLTSFTSCAQLLRGPRRAIAGTSSAIGRAACGTARAAGVASEAVVGAGDEVSSPPPQPVTTTTIPATAHAFRPNTRKRRRYPRYRTRSTRRGECPTGTLYRLTAIQQSVYAREADRVAAMIAALHCHYPMHLLPADRHPHARSEDWLERLRDELQAGAEAVLARALNDPDWDAGWRVDLAGLERAQTRTVCSVLFWPPAEFDLDRPFGAAPEPGYFDDLKHHLTYVEDKLREQDPNGDRHRIVRRAADLDDDGRVALTHCVEGGFHLGPDEDAIDANVRWLADHGVVYVTLAHLFFRGVAANAPAIPMLSDEEYARWFPQRPGIGLTRLGKAAVRAMYRHRVLVDLSHMRQDSLDATFALLDELDDESGADPRDYPVIATHVGMRGAGPDAQAYNCTPATVERVKARGGIVGVILAQHQLGETANEEDSRAVLYEHIDAIADAAGGHE